MQYQFLVKKKSVQEQLQFLFDNNKEEFNKFFASTQSQKITHSNLEKWFIDSNGVQYYQFPKKMALPVERLGQLKGYYTFLASGLSGEEHIKIIEQEEKILSEGIGKPETAAKLGALIHIKRERLKLVLHTELYYNIIAVQAIRDDEDPVVFNQQIHLQKVAQFKTEVQKQNAYFFFQQIQLQEPINLLRISQAEFTTLWHESEVAIQSLTEVLSIVQSDKKYTTLKKSSPSS